jgi:hypothetical protein
MCSFSHDNDVAKGAKITFFSWMIIKFRNSSIKIVGERERERELACIVCVECYE